MDNKWCVYLHIVHADCGYEKYYVGITSTTVEKRWGKDGKGYSNQLFGKAIKKYGWNNIEHIILDENLSECKAKELEKHYIEQYKSYDTKFGYNLTLGGDGSVGWKPSEETKKKISVSLSGQNHPMYGKYHTEEYKQYMRTLNLGKKMSENDKKKLSDRKKKDIADGKILPPMTGKTHTLESKNKIAKNKIGKKMGVESGVSKKVYQYDMNGTYLNEYYGSFEAERQTNVGHSGINACCNNTRNSAGGYMWSYEKKEKLSPYVLKTKTGRKVNQYDENKNFINTFSNIHEAHVLTGANEQNISACCRGVRKMCGGYIWEYAS